MNDVLVFEGLLGEVHLCDGKVAFSPARPNHDGQYRFVRAAL